MDQLCSSANKVRYTTFINQFWCSGKSEKAKIKATVIRIEKKQKENKYNSWLVFIIWEQGKQKCIMGEQEDDRTLKPHDQKRIFRKLLTFRKYLHNCVLRRFSINITSEKQGKSSSLRIGKGIVTLRMGKQRKFQWKSKYLIEKIT